MADLLKTDCCLLLRTQCFQFLKIFQCKSKVIIRVSDRKIWPLFYSSIFPWSQAFLSCTLILSWGLLSIEAQGFEEDGENQLTKSSQSCLSILLKHGVNINKKEVNDLFL